MSNTIYSDKIKVNCQLVHDEDGFYHLVYKITNAINGKIYIGKHSTKNPYDNYMGSGLKIGQAIKKYGIENFTKEILYCFTDEKEAFLKEEEIVDFEFVKNENTYNIAVGGNMIAGSWSGEKNPMYGKPSAMRGKHHTQEAKDKMSKATKGKLRSQETKDKISKSKRGEKAPWYGKHLPQEIREKLSKINSGKNNPMYGKSPSKETRDKLSKANSGKNNPMYGRCGESAPMYGRRGEKSPIFGENNPAAKAVLKLDEFDNIITEYGCIKDCCAQENLSRKMLNKLIKAHTIYNGFYFEYKNKK